MLHQSAQSIVPRQIQEMPVEALIVIPFVPLTKFAAHEEQFLARLTIHPRVKHPEIGKLLPFVARHFRNERPFAVHNFVVTEDENEMLLKGVEQREGNVAVMKTAIDRIETRVLQEVMHPTHVPFESEPETPEISRPGNARPGG